MFFGRGQSLIGLIAVTAFAFVCGCSSVYEEQDWIGLTENEIRTRLGEPSSASLLTLSSASRLYEYQSGLYDHLALDKGNLEVKELKWKGFYKTTAVWLRKDPSGNWRVMETLVWRANVSM